MTSEAPPSERTPTTPPVTAKGTSNDTASRPGTSHTSDSPPSESTPSKSDGPESPWPAVSTAITALWASAVHKATSFAESVRKSMSAWAPFWLHSFWLKCHPLPDPTVDEEEEADEKCHALLNDYVALVKEMNHCRPSVESICKADSLLTNLGVYDTRSRYSTPRLERTLRGSEDESCSKSFLRASMLLNKEKTSAPMELPPMPGQQKEGECRMREVLTTIEDLAQERLWELEKDANESGYYSKLQKARDEYCHKSRFPQGAMGSGM